MKIRSGFVSNSSSSSFVLVGVRLKKDQIPILEETLKNIIGIDEYVFELVECLGQKRPEYKGTCLLFDEGGGGYMLGVPIGSLYNDGVQESPLSAITNAADKVTALLTEFGLPGKPVLLSGTVAC